MAVETQDHPQPTTTSLVSGIIDDVQNLVKQQFQLTRREVEQDLRKSKEAAQLYAVGVGMLLLACVEMCLMAAYLLHWATSPAGSDPASIPLWACHAIVGAVLGVIGYMTMSAGSKRFETIDPLNGPTADALKDNLEWKTKPN
jgi:hypothetical protein